jgi:outer membrane receptor for ferrienterochelin and colicins
MRKLFFIAVLHLLSSPLFSQKQLTDANIVGHVTSGGEHLAGVSILIQNTNTGTITDHTGHYSLTNVPIGNLRIRAQSLGYKPQVVELAIQEGITREVKFELVEDLLGLAEVVVTANRNETNRQEAPVIVNILNSKLFQATNSVCLSEGLSYQPGLRVENNCQNCGFQQVRINGLEGPYTQILIDSRPIYSALSGVYGIEQIPVNMVERVEIVRGGGSALYGSNAIAGTINIITRESNGNSFDLSDNLAVIDQQTADNTTSLNGSIVSDDRLIGLNMFASQRSRGHYDANGDGYSELGIIHGNAIGFRSYFKTSKYSKITATYHFLNEFRRGGNKFDLQPHETNITEQTEHDIHGGELAFDGFSPDQKHKISAYLSGQKIKRSSYYGAQQDLNAYGKTDDVSAVGGIQYVHELDKLWFSKATFTAGTEVHINNLHDQMPGYNRDLKQNVHIAGFFAQNEWNAGLVHFLVGARIDRHNLIRQAIISPRTNFLVDITEKLQWRTSFSTGYRAPQAFDEDLHILAVGGEVMLIELDPNLKPERSRSLSTSLDCYYNVLGVENNFMVEGFSTKLTDVFLVEEIGVDSQGNKLMERRNGSGAKVQGLNLENRMVFGPRYQLQFGATLQQSRYLKPETWSDDPNTAPLKKMPRSPETYGYLSISANPTKNFKLFLSGTYTGRMLIPHYAGYIAFDGIKETPQFFDFNLKFSYDIRLTNGVKMRLETGAQNILNSYQTDFDKGELRDAGYMYGPMKPRTLFLGLKIGTF